MRKWMQKPILAARLLEASCYRHTPLRQTFFTGCLWCILYSLNMPRVFTFQEDCCVSGQIFACAWRLLTHWGRVMHICISKLTTIGSVNGLSPGGCQAIIWTNAGILLIRRLGTNLSEISSEICTFSFKKMQFWKCRLENAGHIVSASMC